jgi:DNA-directed RNA polymerase subunit alpha
MIQYITPMDDFDFKIKEITASPDYGEFVIEPLQPGYGHTMGNALRRVLYTSIPGAAITTVRINGVKHKFTTLKGLKENIVDLLLNLKEVIFRLGENKDSATIKVSIKGEKQIKAKDLETTDGVEVVNKDQYIGSLSAGTKLDMELTVEKGYGYSLAEERKEDTLGVITTDAVFTPVRRVNYNVVATRVGRQTNLDKLIFKIWTNGTISPRESLDMGAKLLASYFQQLYKPKNEIGEENEENKIQVPDLPEKVLKMTIDELDLPTRIYNSLRNGGIETIEQLIGISRKDLISMRNMGGKSISIIKERLGEKNIELPIG